VEYVLVSVWDGARLEAVLPVVSRMTMDLGSVMIARFKPGFEIMILLVVVVIFGGVYAANVLDEDVQS
jgi:hypothetical protein